jgi:hypothetical protein
VHVTTARAMVMSAINRENPTDGILALTLNISNRPKGQPAVGWRNLNITSENTFTWSPPCGWRHCYSTWKC